jgi:hypothetical protein
MQGVVEKSTVTLKEIGGCLVFVDYKGKGSDGVDASGPDEHGMGVE